MQALSAAATESANSLRGVGGKRREKSSAKNILNSGRCEKKPRPCAGAKAATFRVVQS